MVIVASVADGAVLKTALCWLVSRAAAAAMILWHVSAGHAGTGSSARGPFADPVPTTTTACVSTTPPAPLQAHNTYGSNSKLIKKS